MSKVNDGILIGYQASAGSLVGSVTNGKAILAKSGTKKEPTLGQQILRDRFTMARSVVSLFYPAMSIGYRNFASGKKNLPGVCMSHIFNNETLSNSLPVVFNYTKLQLSKGVLLPFSGLTHQFVDGVLQISWKKPQRDLNGDDTDLIYLVVFYPELEQMEIFTEDIRRKDLKLDFSFDQDLPASVAHCYLFIASEINSAVSNSYYISVPNFKE